MPPWLFAVQTLIYGDGEVQGIRDLEYEIL